jgi:hypothetical protein
MKHKKRAGTKDPFVLWILLGIPILFIAASPLHFLYGWTGDSPAVGLFAPVNESPWEHLKMTFWPILIWWIVGYLAFGAKKEGAFPRAAVSCAVCALTCNLFIVAFFYICTGAFGVESLLLDILSVLLGLAVGVLLAVHVTKHTSPGAFAAFLAVVLLLLMAGSFIYFTFAPPHLPIFRDPPSGSYGIYRQRG